MGSLLALAFGAVASPLALAWFVRVSDRRREPKRVVAATFFLGMLAPIPVVWAMPNLIGWFPGANPFQAALLISFGMAAVPEELMKFAVVRFYAARHRQFDEPLDGMVYGVVAALGFAATENIAYSLNQGWGVTLFRSCTAIPLHAAVGAIMGHYVAGARFARPGERRSLGRALLIPIVVHACYDFPLFAGKLAHEAQHPWAQRVWFDAALQCLALAVLASAILEAMQHWRQARETKVSRFKSKDELP